MATLRGDISFRYLKQFFLVYSDFFLDLEHFRVIDYKYKVKIKNNYLTLKSKVKVPRRSLGYTTHHLMVMHPHIKYN
jgi:hypothetical protein